MTITLKAVTTKRCMICGKTGTVSVSSAGHRRWMQGALIQNALPELDADQREQLISGTHPACWGELFEEPKMDWRGRIIY